MDRYTDVSPGLRALAQTVPGMVLAYAASTGHIAVVADVFNLGFQSMGETPHRVHMGRVGPVYPPPVGAGGALMKETTHA